MVARILGAPAMAFFRSESPFTKSTAAREKWSSISAAVRMSTGLRTINCTPASGKLEPGFRFWHLKLHFDLAFPPPMERNLHACWLPKNP